MGISNDIEMFMVVRNNIELFMIELLMDVRNNIELFMNFSI